MILQNYRALCCRPHLGNLDFYNPMSNSTLKAGHAESNETCRRKATAATRGRSNHITIIACRIISHRIRSYHIISHHIISYHIISYHIISYHIISYHIISDPNQIKSNHIISYHIISYHIRPDRIKSNHIISYQIRSDQIISDQIISYHIVSYQGILLTMRQHAHTQKSGACNPCLPESPPSWALEPQSRILMLIVYITILKYDTILEYYTMPKHTM